MEEKIPEVLRRKRLLDLSVVVLAALGVVVSAVLVIFSGGSPTGFAVSDVPLFTGSTGTDDALYFSYLIDQHGRIDMRVLDDYERFLAFQGQLNYVYASSEMGQKEMAPLDVGEAEFSSEDFHDRYSAVVPAYNRLVGSAAEVASGNKAAVERFLAEFYSFGLYIGGISSGAYWRLSELPGYAGLAEVRAKFGDEMYNNIVLNTYNMLVLSDRSMPFYQEWV